ncbi:MAG: cytoskeleton protein RodZ [Gammaproteobacteria bacterium]|jgi:cytoskeleton protein RodZ
MSSRNDETESPGSGPKSSPGRLIAQARDAHSLSPGALAARLRLDPKVIQALERDDFGNLPAPMFVKGYIRSIAKELNLDAEIVLNAYDGLAAVEPPALADFTSRAPVQVGVNSTVIKGVTLGLIGLLVVLVVIWWQSQGDIEETVTEEQNLRDDSIDLLVYPDVEASLDLPGWPPDLRQEDFAQGDFESESEANFTAETVAQNDAVGTQVDADDEAGEQDLPPGSQQLVVKTKSEAWVEIYAADGSALYFGLAKADKPIELDGHPYYRLIVGNTDSINLQHAAKDIDIKSLAVEGVAQFELGSKPATQDESQ